ncbi:hypothetical protein D3C81_2072260 [compost metagenome]
MADARPVEDLLNDQRSAEQCRQLEAHQGDCRQQRIAERMGEQHLPLLQPLGPGRADIVLLQHINHIAAEITG